MYELDLTLRNNITTEENPLGVYHPHAEKHNIKKENIGINSFPVKKMSPHICSITVIHRIMDKFLRQKILAVPCLQG